jgi:hypothetical protein
MEDQNLNLDPQQMPVVDPNQPKKEEAAEEGATAPIEEAPITTEETPVAETPAQ